MGALVWIVGAIAALVVLALPGYVVGRLGQQGPDQAQPVRCQMCRKAIYSRDRIGYEQSLYIQVGNADKARQIEQQQGYQCTQCGARYCKSCLEKRAPFSAAGGRACPNCGGSFQYMP